MSALMGNKPVTSHSPGRRHGWRIDRQFHVLLSLMIVLSFAYSVTPSGFQYQLSLDGNSEEVGVGPWFKIQWVPLYLIALFVLLQRFILFTHLIRHINPLLIAVLLWSLFSAAWADDPNYSFRQAVIVCGVALIAVSHTLASWQPEQLETRVRWTYTIMCLISLIVALAMPQIGVHQSDVFELRNSWKGICQAKYFLGHIAQMSALLWGYLWITGRARARTVLPWISLSILLLIKSRSNTSLIVLLIGLSLILIILRPPLRLRHTAPAFRIAIVMAIFVPAFIYLLFVGEVTYRSIMEPVSGYFGKDITISGRTFIWEELWRVIHLSDKNYWLGVGYLGFWRGPGSLADQTLRVLGWPCPDGHNGYLDIWNQLGLIGLCLLLAFLSYHAKQLRHVAKINPSLSALHFAIFVMVLIENLTNSGFFKPIAPAFLLLTYSSLALSRVLLEQRIQAALRSHLHQTPTGDGAAALR